MIPESGAAKQEDSKFPKPFHPFVLILDNLRSAYNVGNIFRLAEVCRITQIATCGYTPAPPHKKLEKTARDCDKKVPHIHFESSFEAVQFYKRNGYQTVAIETVPEAPDIWDLTLNVSTAFVFGNEAFGIKNQTLKECDLFAKLPVFGSKNSLNVSNCAAAVVYAAIHQYISKKPI